MQSSQPLLLLALAVGLGLPALALAVPNPPGKAKVARATQGAKASPKAATPEESDRIKRQRWPTQRPGRKLSPAPALGPVPFPEGERLKFDIEMLGAKAGEALLVVGKRGRKDGRAVVPLAAFLRSSEFLSRFYPIDDQLRVIADERSFLPVSSTFNIRENGKAIDYETEFQQDRRLLLSRRDKDGRRLDRNFTSETALYDALTSIYAARRLDLKAGLSFEYYVWDGRRERLVKVEVVGDERLWTPLGWAETVRVDISTTITGGFVKGDELGGPIKRGSAWFAKDPYRTPLKLTTPTKLGEAKVTLTRRWVELEGAASPQPGG